MTESPAAPPISAPMRFLRLYGAGVFLGPVLILAPLGLLDLVGVGLGTTAAAWGVAAIFVLPILPAALLLKRSEGLEKPGELITGAYERVFAGVLVGGGRALVRLLGVLLVPALVAFVVAGLDGLLWFGVKQLI